MRAVDWTTGPVPIAVNMLTSEAASNFAIILYLGKVEQLFRECRDKIVGEVELP